VSLEQVFADARRLPRVHHQMEARLAMAEVSRNCSRRA
jgi:hypothetical protein